MEESRPIADTPIAQPIAERMGASETRTAIDHPESTRRPLSQSTLMTRLQNELRRIVNSFVQDVAHIARRKATESLRQALLVTSSSEARSVRLSGRSARRTGTQEKRTQEDLAQLSEAFVAYVKRNPGLRIEQINKGMGSTTGALALPIRKLVVDGLIKTKGRKRSTTYFVARPGGSS